MEVLVIAAIAGAGALATWVMDRRRSQRRNRAGRCASCGSSWPDTDSGEAYLIHGRLFCEPCASKAKRRMPWELGAIAGFTLVVLASGATAAGQGVTGVILFSALGVTGMLVGAVQVMKLANRQAQRRIARGDYPDLAAFRGGEEEEQEQIEGPKG